MSPAGNHAEGPRPTPAVVALGGGHGLATTLGAVRTYAGKLTAVVSVADDGGSSGRLRRTVGIPAPGDLRRCLVALADPDSLWARAMEHRFVAGDLEGHALGNLVIAGLAEATGDFSVALDEAARLLGVAARVLPAVSVPVALQADVAGVEVDGQVNIAHAEGRITQIRCVPPDAPVPHEVLEAIEAADQVVLGPGSLYTSVLAVSSLTPIRKALAGRGGGRVYVCNLRPQIPETAGFSPADHLQAIFDHEVDVDVIVAGRPRSGEETKATEHERSELEELADSRGIRVVHASLWRTDGYDAHDRRRLAAVLGALAAERSRGPVAAGSTPGTAGQAARSPR